MEYALLAALAIGVWLALTWWNADDQPTLAPFKEGRITFKKVVQDAFRDVLDVFAPAVCLVKRLWTWAAPKATNPTTWAALITNFALAWPTIVADPLGQAFLSKYPLLYLLGAIVGLLATRQPNAPSAVPPPPSDGLVNNHSLQVRA